MTRSMSSKDGHVTTALLTLLYKLRIKSAYCLPQAFWDANADGGMGKEYYVIKLPK